jgi:DNA helicase-2/ATP-dependent DNA helicase PcrA
MVPGKYKKVVNAGNASLIPANGSDPGEFAEGDAVQHERFGNGKIISIEGVPPNTTATVEFENDGRKKLLLRFAKLKKV